MQYRSAKLAVLAVYFGGGGEGSGVGVGEYRMQYSMWIRGLDICIGGQRRNLRHGEGKQLLNILYNLES